MTEARYERYDRRVAWALPARIPGLRPGERLPSDACLGAQCRVSRMTARNAMPLAASRADA